MATEYGGIFKICRREIVPYSSACDKQYFLAKKEIRPY